MQQPGVIRPEWSCSHKSTVFSQWIWPLVLILNKLIWYSIETLLKEYFTDLALHSYNLFGLMMDVLKKKGTESKSMQQNHRQSFLVKIWCLHYQQCNTTTKILVRDFAQLLLEPQKALYKCSQLCHVCNCNPQDMYTVNATLFKYAYFISVKYIKLN